MTHVLENEVMKIEVSELGAELLSVVAHGSERLWQNGSGAWAGHAPFLFPWCGKVAVKVDGKEYPLVQHGVARQSNFKLVGKGKDFLLFSLTDTEETHKIYPFKFRFDVEYRMEGDSLSIDFTVKNTDGKTIYVGFGGHESYALQGEGSFIRFPEEERFVNLVHGPQSGMLTGERQDLGTGKILPLKYEYFEGGKTLIFGGINSRFVELCNADGKAIAKVEFEGFENLLFWSAGDRGMVCIEPWSNLPDDEGDTRELKEKPLTHLKKGETLTAHRKITYLA